jgi:hypothetical protein
MQEVVPRVSGVRLSGQVLENETHQTTDTAFKELEEMIFDDSEQGSNKDDKTPKKAS